MREATIERKTKETDIALSLAILDKAEAGSFTGSSGVGFFDHMLNAICVHGHFRMNLKMTGDLEVDIHHSLEDFGIVMGKAFKTALDNGQALTRFGTSYIPMDEALARCVLDISNRPYLVYHVSFVNQYIGAMDTCMFKEFFYAFAMQSGITLHLECLYGENDHHKAEAVCKAFAHALSDACVPSDGAVLSTKGTLNS